MIRLRHGWGAGARVPAGSLGVRNQDLLGLSFEEPSRSRTEGNPEAENGIDWNRWWLLRVCDDQERFNNRWLSEMMVQNGRLTDA